jgi:hypothetical protein
MNVNLEEILKTNIVKCDKSIIEKRSKMINEAINTPSGSSIDTQEKTIIQVLQNGSEVYFYKPDKETLRTDPNLHDMTPNISINDVSVTSNFTFENIWEYLLKISIINQITFKKVLVILYRICYLIDHKESNGSYRYRPDTNLLELFNYLAYLLKEGFKDKFKKEEIGFIEFLNFVDILAWNEDVKYHSKNRRADFNGAFKPKAGRINTIITIISVPLMINEFLLNIMENVSHLENIKINLILSTIQKMSKSRGIFTVTNKELAKKLSPYLISKVNE